MKRLVPFVLLTLFALVAPGFVGTAAAKDGIPNPFIGRYPVILVTPSAAAALSSGETGPLLLGTLQGGANLQVFPSDTVHGRGVLWNKGDSFRLSGSVGSNGNGKINLVFEHKPSTSALSFSIPSSLFPRQPEQPPFTTTLNAKTAFVMFAADDTVPASGTYAGQLSDGSRIFFSVLPVQFSLNVQPVAGVVRRGAIVTHFTGSFSTVGRSLSIKIPSLHLTLAGKQSKGSFKNGKWTNGKKSGTFSASLM